MDSVIVVSILVLGGIAILAAVILYVIARKFKVEEDPRIDQVAECLPGANCGGCGYAGCRNFAEACVKDFNGKVCTAGGNDVMKKVAEVLGVEAVAADAKVAVVRCRGSKECRPRTNKYEGAPTCAKRDRSAGGQRRKMYRLRCLRQGLSKGCNRTPQKSTQVPQGVRFVHQQGQRRGGKESLFVGLYRLRQVRQDLPLRGYHGGKQCRLHRLQQVQDVPQMRGAVSHRRNHGRKLPAAQTKGRGRCCRRSRKS